MSVSASSRKRIEAEERRRELLEEHLRKARAREHLLEFTKYTKPDYQAGFPHVKISEAIDEMIHGDLRRLIISMPPQHGKTELVSRRLPALLLGRNPNEKIIATSFGADSAERINRDVQSIIDSDEYKALFPGTRLGDANVRTLSGGVLRNSSIFEIVGAKGYYLSAGVDGPITGKGGKWLFVDDPVKNREKADSKIDQEKTWNWYRSTLYSRRAKDCRILVIMTRWNDNDLAGKLIALGASEPKSDQFRVLELQAIADYDKPAYDTREIGQALWPEFQNEEELATARVTMGDYDWFALYQQRPRQGGGVEWPEAYWGPDIWFDEWPRDVIGKTMGVDPSKGAQSKAGDYGAVVQMVRCSRGFDWVQAPIMARYSIEELIEEMIEAQSKFLAELIAFETNSLEDLSGNVLIRSCRGRSFPVPIVPVLNSVPKPTRIRRLGPGLRGKQYRFKAGCQGTKLLVEMLRQYPNHDYDDGPDALEMAKRAMDGLIMGRANSGQQSKGVRTR